MVYIIGMIERIGLLTRIKRALKRSRVVVLIGPRQCGKTTIARNIVDVDSTNYFDLEDPVSLARLDEPMTALRDLEGIVVIDEVQRRPNLFPLLRVLSDREPLPCRFLVLGSASPDLLKQSSESLAGRMEIIEMAGFTIEEAGFDKIRRHWLLGGFPRSYIARSIADSISWRKNFIQTILERDLPQLGFKLPATTLLRFWTMLAHYHGQIWNASELSQSVGVNSKSVRYYVDVLSDIFMMRQLQPWHANVKKRQVKAPKMYVRDSGILHQLLGVQSEKDLLVNPKCGASWEGYVIEETIAMARPDEFYFWATHNGAEIDLIIIKNGTLWGVECKRSDVPRITPSMQIALQDLGLKKIFIIYPGDRSFPLSDKIDAVAFNHLATKIIPLLETKVT